MGTSVRKNTKQISLSDKHLQPKNYKALKEEYLNERKKRMENFKHNTFRKVSVYETTDYDIFYELDINRTVNYRLVDRIRNSMEKYFLDDDFIFCIETEIGLGILDGQHRFHALMGEGKPIRYIVITGDPVQTIIAYNIQKQWNELQFIKTFAKAGNENYAKVLKLKKDYPDINHLRIYISLLTNTSYGGVDRKSSETKVRDGKLKISVKDYDRAEKICEKILEFKELKKSSTAWGHAMFFNSLIKVFNHPRYDKNAHERLKKALISNGNSLTRNNFVFDYLTKFSEFYNKDLKKKENKIYFQIDLT